MEDSLKIIGEYGIYQNQIKVILLSCVFFTNIFSFQIGLMLDLPKLNIIEKKQIIVNNSVSFNLFLLSNITKISSQYCNENKYIFSIGFYSVK